MKAFVLASTSSNSGKTLVSSLLMNLFKDEFEVVAFKIGPDYIDPKFHELVLDKPSYNLDLNLLDFKTIKHLFSSHLEKGNLAIIEGVMGLFDGKVNNSLNSNGSSFDLAKQLGLPIILLVNCNKKGQSVIAEILGYIELAKRNNYKINGIILNQTTESNYLYLKKELEKYSDAQIFGFIPKLKIELDSRHLGLKEPFENTTLKEKINFETKNLTKTLDIKSLLNSIDYQKIEYNNLKIPKKYKGLNIGVAYDEAFNFYYNDNLELMELLGCNLIKFSPLRDSTLPSNLNLIYLGGGYPELYFNDLEKNKNFIESIKDYIKSGKTCLAECGGLLYLSNRISYENNTFRGLGIFDVDINFGNHLVHFGYNKMTFNNMQINTHEFHYSDYCSNKKPDFLFKIQKGNRIWNDGMRYKNTFGFYPHIHFYAKNDGFKFLNYFLEKANGS